MCEGETISNLMQLVANFPQEANSFFLEIYTDACNGGATPPLKKPEEVDGGGGGDFNAIFQFIGIPKPKQIYVFFSLTLLQNFGI